MKVIVSCNGMYVNSIASVEIPEIMERRWMPVKTSDSPIMCLATGEHQPDSEHVKYQMTLREDACKLLSGAITEKLLEQMMANDTHNGYKKEERS